MPLFRRLSAASATVLVASGLVVAPFLTGPAAAAELIQDGSFEAATGNPAQQPQLDRGRLRTRHAPICLDVPPARPLTSISPPRTGNN